MKRPAVLVSTALVTLAAHAHHSAAMYDMEQLVTVEGTVLQYDWANPHVYIRIEQLTESGERIEWSVEGYPPAAMRRSGWSERTLRPGDALSVTGNPTKDARNMGLYPATIEVSGRTLFEQASMLERLASPSVTPRTRATDLAGTWETLARLDVILHFYNPDVTLTEAGTAAHESYVESTMLPALECVPYSAPLLMIDPDFKRIAVEGDTVTIDGGFAPAVRTIDLRKVDHEGAGRTVQGHSIGRWDDGTLVVDTTRFAEHRTGNGYRGVASGRRKHLVERLTLHESGTRLTYEFELSDPEFLAEPVTGKVEWAYRPDLEFVREPCEADNARRFVEQ